MDDVKRWTVLIDIDECDGCVRAIARLHTGDNDRTVSAGTARPGPAEQDGPPIADELATARALSQLSHRLLNTLTRDLERASA